MMEKFAELVEFLSRNSLKISAIESCTGGMFASNLTAIPGSSKVFEIGFVTYSDQAKEKFTKVPHFIIEKFGSVSSEAAESMAENCLHESGADIAIAITGFAGPEGGTKDLPIGSVFLGLAFRQEIYVKKLTISGNRHEVRNSSCSHAVEFILEQIKKEW